MKKARLTRRKFVTVAAAGAGSVDRWGPCLPDADSAGHPADDGL